MLFLGSGRISDAVRSSVLARLEAGDPAIEVVTSFPPGDEREAAAAVALAWPVPSALTQFRTSRAVILVIYGVVAALGAVVFGLNFLLGLARFADAIGTLGDGFLLYGLYHNRVWAMVGFPWWIGLGLVMELQEVASVGLDWTGLVVVALLYFGLLLCAWLVVVMKGHVFPLAGPFGMGHALREALAYGPTVSE